MALHKKLMRDSVTGKLMRDSATGKLMRYNPIGDDCGYCDAGQTPAKIKIRFSNVIDCTHVGDNCTYGGGGPTDYYYIYRGATGWISNFNGVYWTLPQISPCVWSKTFTISWLYWDVHNDENCSSYQSSSYITSLTITVTKTGASSATIVVSQSPHGTNLFSATYTPDDCVSGSGIPNANTEPCTGGVKAIDGTANVVEIG